MPMARVFYTFPQRDLENLIAEIPYMLGGMAVKPEAPIMWGDSMGTTMIPGFGVTESAELQDLAYRAADKRRQDWRERFGFPSRESFDTRLREHMEERMKRPADKKWHQHD